MFEAMNQAFGPTGVIWFTGLLAAVSVYCLLYGVFGVGPQVKSGAERLGLKAAPRADMKVKASNDRRREIQDQLKKQEEQRKQKTGTMEAKLERARLKWSVAKLYTVFSIIAAGATAGLMLWGLKPMFAVAAFPVVAFLLPRKFVSWRIAKVEKAFIAHFPDSIDVLVRGVRTGLPVNEGMRLVAREMPSPISDEFRQITDATAFGVTLEDALDRMYTRMPLAEVNFFNIVMTIQKQTGGNLSEALGNLSNTLRDRKKLKMKIKALSSEAKASAGIIGSLPFILALLVYIVTPDYIELLFTTSTGNMMMAAGGVWMGIGIFVMKTMINIEI